MGWSKHHPVGLIHYALRQCYRGYTLLTTADVAEGSGGDRFATLIDMEGRICHRWQSNEGIRYGYLLPNGHLLCRTRPPAEIDGAKPMGGSSAAILEVDWDSVVVWEYRDPLLHHDFERLPNGNTLVLLWHRLSKELTSQIQGGRRTDEDPEQMLGDVVQEITPAGSVAYEWRSWEHLSPAEDIICPLEGRQEWTHANSLASVPDKDFLISFRQTSAVGIVNRTSGDFRWKWGPGELSHQHHAVYLDNGHVLLFDNGVHHRGPTYSRVLEVDPRTDQIVWEYRGDPLISFYSFHISGAERLPNENTLICEGAPGRLLEVTPNHEIVWEYVNPFFSPSGSSGVSNSIFQAHRYGPDHPALAGKDLDPGRYANLNRLYAGT